MVEVLNSDLKRDNSKLNLYLIDIKRKNCEKKETVNEMDPWNASGSLDKFFFRMIERSNSELWEGNFIRGLEMADLRG